MEGEDLGRVVGKVAAMIFCGSLPPAAFWF
jgi:hypothetical protein